ncbi:hypothetical protein BDW62DRAFT_209198 [Aspergillus aurantiobrunneus]
MYSFVWRLLPALFLISCTTWYAKAHFYRDPGSAFFDPSRAYEQRYSLTRKTEVQRFLDSQHTTTDGRHAASGKVATLCVGLASVRREKTQYLETTIGSLLQGLTDEERADLYLSALIAEPDASEHPSWNKQWLREAIDDLYTYNTTAGQTSHLDSLKKTGRYAEKGIFDYTHALARCYESGTPYIAMFEDDTLFADGWFIRTLHGLGELRSRTNPHAWLYMRLFNQERSTGWASHDIGGNNESWIILGLGLAISALAVLVRRRWWLARVFVDPSTIFVLVFVLNPALVLLYFQCGKASMLPPRPGVYDEPFGCCSQAMVFPRVQAPLVMEYLQGQGKGQVDLMLNDLAEEAELSRYALYPVQAQHIGIDSARQTEENEAQAIWSMAYEDLDPTRLALGHREMVAEYYGHRTG